MKRQLQDSEDINRNRHVFDDDEESLSDSQWSYLFDLVVRHPNFQKTHDWDVYEATDDWIIDWLNEKYGDFLSRPLKKPKDIAKYEATELITRLKERVKYANKLGDEL